VKAPFRRAACLLSCRLLASLEHPNVLSFYEAFAEHQHLFVVTELAIGGDLAALLE
jgi:hypothetical protein